MATSNEVMISGGPAGGASLSVEFLEHPQPIMGAHGINVLAVFEVPHDDGTWGRYEVRSCDPGSAVYCGPVLR